jgi:dipeptidyl aminopeptidase/acylaminoacyl peptidase
VISAADGTKKQIQLPAGARVSNATWSPDGKSIAFFVHGEDATHIWMADATTGVSRQVTKTPVLATLVTSFDFTKDGKQIATVMIPDNRPAMPQAPASPTGPSVKLAMETDKNRLRTFPSLMSTPYDEQLLEWHSTGQLALVDVANGTAKKIGGPAMIRAIDVAPDGKYVRVTRMLKPFSYDVPVANFGQIDEIWDETGKAVAKISDRPLNAGVASPDDPPADQPPAAGGGRGGQQTGKREVAWRLDGQGLTYVEQEPAPARARGNADDAAAAGGDDQPTAAVRAGGGGVPNPPKPTDP